MSDDSSGTDESAPKSDQKPGIWDRWLSAPVKYLGIVVPIGAALIAAWIQWNEFQDQRERLARFTAGEEVIKLAEQLNDQTKPEMQSLAAYRLAWFGRPAAFVLFEQMIPQERKSVRAAIVMSLAEISRSDKETPGMTTLLAQSTRAFANATLEDNATSDDDAPDLDGVEQRLVALATVAAAIRSDGDDASDYRAVLGTIRETIGSQPSARVPDETKTRLLGIIDRALQPLGP